MNKKTNKKSEDKQFSTWTNTLINALIQIFGYICGISLSFVPLLFTYLNIIQEHYFIDEKFHVPQTIQYCSGNFFHWDQKITTLPGLYVFAALILGPFKLCTTTHLRLINLLLTFTNLWLAYLILKKQWEKSKNDDNSRFVYVLFLGAWNIAFFPPLFFWFFLFYTDVFSVTLFLLMLLCHVHKKDKTSAFVGALAVCVRQTNIIWVAYAGIERGLDSIELLNKKQKFTDSLNIFSCAKSLFALFKVKIKRGVGLKFFKLFFKPFVWHLLVLLIFGVFVIYNDGIVIGDRNFHKPTIHVVQIFYFSIFVLTFAWPYLLSYVSRPFVLLSDHLIIATIFSIGVIVHQNTLIHPFLLADNRHYSFYVWKNFMNRYQLFKYCLVPVYAFSLYAILKSMSHLRKLSLVTLVICVCSVLIPQLLLEPRYFIIPYILYKLQMKEPKNWQLLIETTITILINVFQFYLFVNKSFEWSDEKHPQRIAW